MSAGLFHQPHWHDSSAPWRVASEALLRLREIAHLALSSAVRRRAPAPAANRSRSGALFQAAEAMLDGGRPCTMLMFQLGDLPELECVFGAGAARVAVAGMERALAKLAGRHGFVARTAPTKFSVVLPIGAPEHALAAVHAVFGRPCSLELQLHGHEIMLAPELALQTLDEAGDVAPTYEVLRGRLAAVRQRRQPRAAAGRSSAVGPRRPDAPRRELPAAPIPATIPMPLGLR